MRFVYLGLLLLVFGCDAGVEEEAVEDQCRAGQIVCDGTCSDPSTDAANCGACGSQCDAASTCLGGICQPVCDEAEENCDGTCVNLNEEPLHCGACGAVCADGEQCEDGSSVLRCDDG